MSHWNEDSKSSILYWFSSREELASVLQKSEWLSKKARNKLNLIYIEESAWSCYEIGKGLKFFISLRLNESNKRTKINQNAYWYSKKIEFFISPNFWIKMFKIYQIIVQASHRHEANHRIHIRKFWKTIKYR